MRFWPRTTKKLAQTWLKENGTPDIHAVEVQVVPGLLEKAVIVPAVVGTDGDAVRDARDDVELLNGDLVNLVEHIDARDVDPAFVCVGEANRVSAKARENHIHHPQRHVGQPS